MRPWRIATAWFVTLAGAALATGITFFMVSMAPTIATKDRTVHLTDDAAHADILVPAGWSWQPHFGDDSRGILGSPDRAMTIEFTLMADTKPVAAVRAVAPAPIGSQSIESVPTAAGGPAELLHARVIEQDVLVGALTDEAATLAFVSTPSPTYDAELAALVSTIEVFG